MSYPTTVAAGELFLIDRTSSRLVTYDTLDERVVNAGSDGQVFQYAFPDGGDLFTSGDSSGASPFVLLQRQGDRLVTLKTLPLGEGLFPLAHGTGGRDYFIHSFYNNDGSLKESTLAVLEHGSLTDFSHVSGDVSGAALVGENLYLSVYDATSDRFAIESVDPADTSARPTDTGMTANKAQLFTWNGSLVRDDDFLRGEGAIQCDLYCLTDEADGVVVSMAVSANQDLVVTAVNVRSGRATQLASGPIIDMALSGSTLTVYLDGSIVTKNLKDVE